MSTSEEDNIRRYFSKDEAYEGEAESVKKDLEEFASKTPGATEPSLKTHHNLGTWTAGIVIDSVRFEGTGRLPRHAYFYLIRELENWNRDNQKKTLPLLRKDDDQRGITVAELKALIAAWPETNSLGDPTEVWIATGGVSNECRSIMPLNLRRNIHGVPSADLLLEPGE